ncbi:hypothetical protein BRE01_60270 [Brevibacillus reuszeri]|uniref:Uncharacterized protein n=1 Tax=Brevibacillus reuszeri TaxID=54915 RepID=A0A0K9YNH7_9BACL|nr:hypothetical protein ADS79_14760 [Brevibacillus reuszeri]GED72325.1 hypothetical protein BRE01_60270 [Brevibacillus reuszeri]
MLFGGKKIRELESLVYRLQQENEELHRKVREVTKWKSKPNWRKEITVSPYVFENTYTIMALRSSVDICGADTMSK